MTAERFNATKRITSAWCMETVHVDALDDTVDGLVKAILSNGPAAVRASKELIGYVPSSPSPPNCATAPPATLPTSAPAMKAAPACRPFEQNQPALAGG